MYTALLVPVVVTAANEDILSLSNNDTSYNIPTISAWCYLWQWWTIQHFIHEMVWRTPMNLLSLVSIVHTFTLPSKTFPRSNITNWYYNATSPATTSHPHSAVWLKGSFGNNQAHHDWLLLNVVLTDGDYRAELCHMSGGGALAIYLLHIKAHCL